MNVKAVVVIFGAAVLRDGRPSETLRRRAAAAVACGGRMDGVLYVPTGAVGRYGASEASVMAGLLRASGVPPERIVLEETGTDTLSSVRAVVRLLGGLPPTPPLPRSVGEGIPSPAERRRAREGVVVHIATSGYHQPRCKLLFRLAGIAAQPCPPPPPAPGFRQRWYWRLRELPAIPYDAILMLLRRS